MNEYLDRMEAQLKKWDADLEVLAAEGQKDQEGAPVESNRRRQLSMIGLAVLIVAIAVAVFVLTFAGRCTNCN